MSERAKMPCYVEYGSTSDLLTFLNRFSAGNILAVWANYIEFSEFCVLHDVFLEVTANIDESNNSFDF